MKSYIIAEAGVNHNGSIDMAYQLIDAASAAGADAVKFQTFKADKIVSKRAPKANYQASLTGEKESQYQMLKRLELNIEDHIKLQNYCDHIGIGFLSTPFDIDSANLLVDELGLKTLKLGSGEITNAPLLLHIARKNVSIILSTGMSSLGDIEQALSVLAFGYTRSHIPSHADLIQAYSSREGQQSLKKKISLLHCTTEYPAPYEEVNLAAIETMRKSFQLPIGFSDHTKGIEVSIAAVALGATIIEKHFTLDKSLPGPDHVASLEPDELQNMIRSIRNIEKSIGSSVKVATTAEMNNVDVIRKSIVAAKPIELGDLFTENNLTVKRPATGMSPMHYWCVIGKKATRKYEVDDVIIDE